MAGGACAAEIEVKMLNKGAEGLMVFEPALVKVAPGDTVKFVATDKGHNAETIKGMLSAGVSLEKALGGFAKMYGKDPGLPLRAMGFFKDGDLPSLPKSDQDTLRQARDRVLEIPEVAITGGSLAIAAPA